MNHMGLHITFCDMNQDVVEHLWNIFADISNVDITQDDILSGTVDAVVSPGNSFGLMDYGLDKIMKKRFCIEKRLQEIIKDVYYGELPVWQAAIIDTGDTDIPYLISSPTMRVPMKLERETLNIYLATRAIFIAILQHNNNVAAEQSKIHTVRIPWMWTWAGRFPLDLAAKQMKYAYEAVMLNGWVDTFPRDWKEAISAEKTIRGDI